MGLAGKFSGQNILVIGDVMLDHYIWGDAYRISPEAPVPVVKVNHDTFAPGGAANVALNLANLGVQTSLLGYCNDDDEGGKSFSKIITKKGISFYHNRSRLEASTIVKSRILVRNQQLCRLDREDKRTLYATDELGYNQTERLSTDSGAIIFSDYHKGVIDQKFYDFVVRRLRPDSRFIVAVDPKPSSGIVYHNATILTPNKQEALQLAGFSVEDAESIALTDICQRIFEIHGPEYLVITLGPNGMAICHKGVIVEMLPANAREVYDVSGAGDTVIATMTACLLGGATISEASALANFAAGCVVGHMGTVPVTLEEITASNMDW